MSSSEDLPWHHPRFTADIDFLVRPDRDNAELVVRTLRDFGFAGLGIVPADLCQPDQVIQLGEKPNRIDLITSIAGVSFEEAWDSRVDRFDSSLFHWERRTDSQQGTGRATAGFSRRGRFKETAQIIDSVEGAQRRIRPRGSPLARPAPDETG